MPSGDQTQRTYDALVIGGGAVGLACAWRLAARGLSTCVVERDRPGAGATGVSAGMLAPVGEATWGEDALLELALASAEAWPGFAAELAAASGEPSTHRRDGALHVALDRDEAEALRRRHELHVELGLESEWLRGRRCRRLEPGVSPACSAGVHAPHEASVDPRALTAALLAALDALGVDFHSGAAAEEAILEGGALRGVRTADGRELRAGAVVLAAGCWSGSLEWLPEEARPPVRPVKGEILTLRGSHDEPVCERIVASERVYAVPRGDGRLVVGATVEERGFDTAVTAGGVHELLREAYRALPDVAELELVEAVAGLRPGSPDNAPLIGPSSLEGLIVATGHYRNGILLTPVTADAVAAIVAGQQPAVSLDAFRPERFLAPSAPAAPEEAMTG